MLNLIFFSLLLILTTQNINSYGKRGLSNLRRCADKHCKEKISTGYTTQRYTGIEKGVLKFKIDELATIYSKEAGTNLDLWGVQIGEKRGYVPKKFIREDKIYVSNANLVHIVPTNIPQNEKQKSDLNPKTNSNAGNKHLNSEGNTEAKPSTEANTDSNTEHKTILNTEGGGIGLSNEGKTDSNHESIQSLNIEDQGVNFNIEGKKENVNTEGKKINQNTEDEKVNFNTEGEEVNFNTEDEVNFNTEGEEVNLNTEGDKVNFNTEGQKENLNTEGKKINLNTKSKTGTNTAPSKQTLDTEGEKYQDTERGINEEIAELNIANVEKEDLSHTPILLNGGDVEFEAMKNLVNPNILPETVDNTIDKAEPGTSNNQIKNEKIISEEKVFGDDPYNHKDENVGTNKEIKKEEMDNEDEGNGNEGEENGNEFAVSMEERQEEHYEIRDFVPSIKEDNSQSNLPPMEPTGKEETLSLQKTTGSSSNTNSQVPKQNIPPSIRPKTDEVSITSNEAALNPTPSEKFEVVDGTTIILEESDLLSVSSDKEFSNTLPLGTSQGMQQGHHITNPTPYSKLENIPITEAPIVQKFKVNQDMKPMLRNVAGVEPIVSVNAETLQEHTSGHVRSESLKSTNSAFPNTVEEGVVSESDTSTEGTIESPSVKESNLDLGGKGSEEESEFSTPKPATVIDPIKKTAGTLTKIENIIEAPQEQEPVDNTDTPHELEDTVDSTEESKDTTNVPEQSTDVDAPQEESGGFFSSLFTSITAITTEEEVEKNTEDLNTPEEFKNSEKLKTHGEGKTPQEVKAPEELKTNEITETLQEFRTPAELETLEELKPMQQIKETPVELRTSEEPTSVDEEGANTEKQTENSQQQESTNNSNTDYLIANLTFVDPDPYKPSAEEGDPAQVRSDSSSDRTKQDRLFDDPSLQNDSTTQHLHSGMGVADESEVPSLKEKLLDVSRPLVNEGLSLAIESELAEAHLSAGTVTFLVVVAGTIVVLYFSHMMVVKISRESPLLEVMNKLDRSQRILMEENHNLKKKLSNSNGQLKSGSSHADSLKRQQLKEEFEGMKAQLEAELAESREKVFQFESDLESSTANEVELHRMLDELLSSQKDTTNFEESVNNLQVMLDGQREVVENLTSDLALKTRLNDELKNELKSSKTRTSKLEYQIEQLSHSLEEATSTKEGLCYKLSAEESSVVSFKEMNDALRAEVSALADEARRLAQECGRLNEALARGKKKLGVKETECQVTKECLKKIRALSDGGATDVNGNLAQVFKIIEVKSQLANIEKEFLSQKSLLEEGEVTQNELKERLSSIEGERNTLNNSLEVLQKERDDAKSKLGVLAQYYEEKETQLKKELQSQEGLLHTVEGSAAVVSNRIQAYEMELSSCRSQMEGLKTELEDQKQSYKIQLTNEEKKLHDSWLFVRAAERRQEELRQENTQLRQKLTHFQRDTDHHQHSMLIKPPAKRVDANGSLSSPVPMDNDLDALHSGLPLDMDGSMPPLPMMPMFTGRPLPPGMAPPPGIPPGLPPPPPMHPHLFGHLPPPHPPMPDRRMPPAGRIASPPGYDRRSYSPGSDYSDHRYSPGRYSPSPGGHPGRQHSPDRKSDLSRRAGNSRRDLRSPSPSDAHHHHHPRHSPERWYTQSPQGGYAKHRRTPPSNDYYDTGINSSDRRAMANPGKGKKTSTPLGPNDR